MDIFGVDLFGEPIKPKPSGVVSARFVMPPFTVLDARGGDWQKRKRMWISTGLKGELGRDAAGHRGWSDLSLNPRVAESTRKIALVGDQATAFDPVLCELVYRWFCPVGGQIVDPFCGGSSRGIVAGALGFNYWGCDLRQEQIEANNEQANEIPVEKRPTWVCGDSLIEMQIAPHADIVFSCPPYGDLERYSDHPHDLSAMPWDTFVSAYRRIISLSCNVLRPNRFACFVVGDFRDKQGFYRNFVSITIDAFEQAGLRLYNEAILVTSVGSASMRVSKQFDSGRKLCKVN
jgi:hypothetical protein